MNRHYYWFKAGLIVAAFCVAIGGSSIGALSLQPRISHSPFTAADTMQADILHTGARLSRLALRIFYFSS
jgi:hypothetical protein